MYNDLEIFIIMFIVSVLPMIIAHYAKSNNKGDK